jgi:hypothetical protein
MLTIFLQKYLPKAETDGTVKQKTTSGFVMSPL